MQTNYYQPDFYRFSDDSIKLVNFVFQRKKNTKILRLLDLCAGCGVVGIEFNLRKIDLQEIHFCEIQDEFIPFLQNNLSALIPNTTSIIHNKSYEQLNISDKFDLILSNPPYFYPGKGLLSPNQAKNRCRFFMDSSLRELVQCIQRNLSPTGEAYFLGRFNSNEFSVASASLSVDYRLEHELDLGSCSIYSLTKTIG
jgi:tRNA1(Val) A37 N6-methylase TrmN6